MMRRNIFEWTSLVSSDWKNALGQKNCIRATQISGWDLPIDDIVHKRIEKIVDVKFSQPATLKMIDKVGLVSSKAMTNRSKKGFRVFSRIFLKRNQKILWTFQVKRDLLLMNTSFGPSHSFHHQEKGFFLVEEIQLRVRCQRTDVFNR